MANHLGEEYLSTIVSFSNQGMFVEIENGLQGFVPFDSISGDYYIFDEEVYRAYGVRKGKEFSLGKKVKVICCNVDLQKYQITFNIIKGDNHGRYKNRRKQ